LSFPLPADDSTALITALGLVRPFVGGWSDGGETALQLGLRHPGLARALIAGGTSLAMGGSERARAETRAFLIDANDVIALDAFAVAEELALLPFLRQSHPGGEPQRRDVVQQSATMWLISAGLAWAEVARNATPPLVVIGDRDEFHPVEERVRLDRWLPNAELAILPGCDHLHPFFTDPASLVRVIVDFLDRH